MQRKARFGPAWRRYTRQPARIDARMRRTRGSKVVCTSGDGSGLREDQGESENTSMTQAEEYQSKPFSCRMRWTACCVFSIFIMIAYGSCGGGIGSKTVYFERIPSNCSSVLKDKNNAQRPVLVLRSAIKQNIALHFAFTQSAPVGNSLCKRVPTLLLAILFAKDSPVIRQSLPNKPSTKCLLEGH